MNKTCFCNSPVKPEYIALSLFLDVSHNFIKLSEPVVIKLEPNELNVIDVIPFECGLNLNF